MEHHDGTRSTQHMVQLPGRVVAPTSPLVGLFPSFFGSSDASWYIDNPFRELARRR
jgi:hypothetical protein